MSILNFVFVGDSDLALKYAPFSRGIWSLTLFSKSGQSQTQCNSIFKSNCIKPTRCFILDIRNIKQPIWECWGSRVLLFMTWKFNCFVCLFPPEEAYQSGRGVLVHCQAGVSRSATIVIAYLMKHTLMTMTDAYKYVRSRRPVVSPNLNFMGQLLEFERDLNSGVTPRILMPKLNGVETQV